VGYLFYDPPNCGERSFLGVILAVVDKFIGCIRQLGPIKFSQALFPQIIAMEKGDRENAGILIELHDVLTRSLNQVLGIHGLGLIFIGERDCGYNQKDNHKKCDGFQFAVCRIHHE